MLTKKLSKVANKYECIKCDYNTYNKTNYKKHLDTQKHYKLTNTYEILQKVAIKYKCAKCFKEYSHKQSLFTHKKTCKMSEIQIINNTETLVKIEIEEEKIDYKQMFLEMFNQNKELQNTIKEIIPKIGNNNTINSNNTNNVSIQVFLNDTCKDAMSITDFIDTIQVSVSDLLYTKENGLVKGISNLFISNLERIPLIQRPLWCSDKKRKRIFIKGEEYWIEDINREKTNDLVNTISKIQTKNINKYVADKPNWMTNDKLKDNYIHIVKSVTDTMDNKIDKIIDNISDKIHLTEDIREKLIK
jgi:hypothetical protein